MGSINGYHLVSGSEDRTIRVWDLHTDQALRVMSHPNFGPVTCLNIVPKSCIVNTTAQQPGTDGPVTRHLYVERFAKYSTTQEEAWTGPAVRIAATAHQRNTVLDNETLGELDLQESMHEDYPSRSLGTLNH